jgi:hypothetical protein
VAASYTTSWDTTGVRDRLDLLDPSATLIYGM